MNENHEPIRKIKLGGILGKKFVKEFHYRARDIPHAIRALKGQFPGFERFMNEAQLRGLTFAVFVGSKNVSEEEVDMTKGVDDIRIIPVIIGSKRGGMFQTILGAALIAASFIPFLAPISPYLMMVGASMLMGAWYKCYPRNPAVFRSARRPITNPLTPLVGRSTRQSRAIL